MNGRRHQLRRQRLFGRNLRYASDDPPPARIAPSSTYRWRVMPYPRQAAWHRDEHGGAPARAITEYEPTTMPRTWKIYSQPAFREIKVHGLTWADVDGDPLTWHPLETERRGTHLEQLALGGHQTPWSTPGWHIGGCSTYRRMSAFTWSLISRRTLPLYFSP